MARSLDTLAGSRSSHLGDDVQQARAVDHMSDIRLSLALFSASTPHVLPVRFSSSMTLAFSRVHARLTDSIGPSGVITIPCAKNGTHAPPTDS